MFQRLYKCLLLLLFALPVFSQQSPAFIRDSLESYIKRGMEQWHIPGLAIAIVKDDQVIWMKGYGERNIETHEPVDENTLFMIASNSKLFTGTSLAQLEYDGLLNLNNRIVQYFPWFRLYDSMSTRQVTIRDMLSHRLGTKTFQGDFTFWNGKSSRRSIMERMRLLQPTGVFRQDYGYCNSCFLTAGEVIPRVTGKPWEVYVHDSLLIPIGMRNTHTLVTGMDQRPNAATPYTNAFTGTLKALPHDQVDNLGPAGSMISNVKDLARWLRLQLDSGRIDGKRILPWDVLRKTRDMNTIVNSRASAVYPSHYTGYGLGLFMNDYNGKQVYWHTGGAFGFVSNTCFVPEAKLGIVILTNNDNQSFFEALRYQILDAYLGVPYTNRSANALRNAQAAQEKSLQQIHAWQERLQQQQPALPLTAFTGTYKHPLYGSIRIEANKDKLLIRFNGHQQLSATLQYLDNGEWLMTYNNIAYGIFATRFTEEAGKISGITIRANDFVEYDSYYFTKE